MGRIARQGLIMASKDMKSFFKDRFAVVFALAFPIMFVLGFSLALADVGPEDEQLTLTVATREAEDGLSHRIIEGLTGGDRPGVQEMAYDEALRAVQDGRLPGFISFPAGFTQELSAGEQVALEVVSDSEAPGSRAALQGFAQDLAGRLSRTQVAVGAVVELRGREGKPATQKDIQAVIRQQEQPPVVFDRDRVGDVEPFNAANFTLPGYLTMFVFFAAALSAEAIAKERRSHTLERLLANGVQRESVVLGKFLGAAYRGLLQLAVLWVAGVFVFRVALGPSPEAVIVISLLMVLASAAFSVMLASVVKSLRASTSAAVLTSLILAPIGGCWWPLFITPEWMQNLAKLTPHGWANTGFNKLMLFGAESGDVLGEMAALLAFTIAFAGLALWRFRTSPAGG